MENIFKGAQFGDIFVTRDGRQATFVGLFIDDEQKIWRKIVIANENEVRYYNNYGKSGLLEKCDGDFPNDLVARYQKPIDEDNMNNYINSLVDNIVEANSTEMRRYNSFCIEDVKELMKQAYKKAKEE